MKKLYVIIALLGIVVSCDQKEETVSVTDPNDYNQYLDVPQKKEEQSKEAITFWSKRLRTDTTGVGNLAPLASAYTTLFQTSGDVVNLKHAERLYQKGVEYSATNKDGFTRSLAHNYISQHRFKEAKELLEDSYKGVSNKHETELMLFDAYMELGEYEKADSMLAKVKNNSDYHYLIRLSKWSDYRGNLDAAIKYMEKARDIAESRDSDALKVWTYSNLGDYYGHAGRIKDAYASYIKTLHLEPDNHYVKKGIAWIAYAAENDPEEALRILDAIEKYHKTPDYLLLRAEIAESQEDMNKADSLRQEFLKAVRSPEYGAMYNAYVIEMLAETQPEVALSLAKLEVENRATPETYHLLALAQLKAGKKQAALGTIEDYVIGKTYEPTALYHAALVYKANGLVEKVAPLKEELLGASFELGPVVTQSIKDL
jgi:tetratricopeptide (TPR) repeat protein